MRTRTTVILAALGAAVLALGLVFGTGPGEQTQLAAKGQLVFPGLVAKLADAAKIEITHKGSTLTLDRGGKGAAADWGIAARADYPAQSGKVHELLANLTELRLDEQRTSDPAEYARLGVADPAGKDADSTLLRVLDGKGGTIAALIVGHARTAPSGGADTLYVRRPGEAQSWLADGKLAPTAEMQDWLDRNIVNIDATKVVTDVVTRGDATLTFGRTGDKFGLTAPTDHPKLDDDKLDEVGGALADLTLQDVRRAPAPGKPLGRAVVTTKDGTVVTADVSKDGADIWATFAASGKDAAALDKKVSGWAYEIGSWKEQALVPTLADLKAAEPTPATPAPATPATPAPSAAAPPAK